ncbi:unnamed protein product, partial [Darwinula stevensoni]
LPAAQVVLTVNNLTIALCAVGVCFLFLYHVQWEGTWILVLMETVVIVLAAIAALASETSKIILEKDWIIVIAGNDNDRLANMNAVFRTIDLATFILAPTLVGAVMSFWNSVGAAIFLASWNLVSVIFEYGLLYIIFKSLPDLAHKKALDTDALQSSLAPDVMTDNVNQPLSNGPAEDELQPTVVKIVPPKLSFKQKILHSAAGWKLYFSHAVFPAAFGLAAIYMTVLGFDNITQGYMFSQGVAEWLVGLLTGIGALTGLLGALAYPFMRRHLSIERTGLFGFGLETFSLCFCVASVFTTGSPFQWDYLWNPEPSNSTIEPNVNATTDSDLVNLPGISDVTISIILFVTSIIAARFGLWVADLTVTQIIQEGVEEEHRGSFNGVQSSMNMLMDLIKNALVTIFPKPQTFGYLIIASFSFVCLGWLSYAIYSRRRRGHLFHFEKVVPCLHKSELLRLRGHSQWMKVGEYGTMGSPSWTRVHVSSFSSSSSDSSSLNESTPLVP